MYEGLGFPAGHRVVCRLKSRAKDEALPHIMEANVKVMTNEPCILQIRRDVCPDDFCSHREGRFVQKLDGFTTMTENDHGVIRDKIEHAEEPAES